MRDTSAFGKLPNAAALAACAPQKHRRRACSCCNPTAQIENSHAHSETVGDLIENHALQTVGDLAVDLDAAVDRAGMHDQTIRLQKFCAFFRQTKQADVFADAGKIFSALAFVLDAQKVHDIGFGQHVIDLVRNLDAKLSQTRAARACLGRPASRARRA